jgi:hypothetical protein
MKGKNIAKGGLALGTGLFVFVLVIVLFSIFIVLLLGSAYVYFSLLFLSGKFLPLWFVLVMFILAVLKLSSLIMRLDAGILAISQRSFFRSSLDGAALVVSIIHTGFLAFLFFVAKDYSNMVVPALIVLGAMLVVKMIGVSLHYRHARTVMGQHMNQQKESPERVEGRVIK